MYYPYVVNIQRGRSGNYIISNRDTPSDPVVKTSPSNAGGVGSIPGQGAKILRVS